MSPFPCKDKDKRNTLKRQYNISTSCVAIQNKIYGLTQLLLWMNLAFLKFLLEFCARFFSYKSQHLYS